MGLSQSRSKDLCGAIICLSLLYISKFALAASPTETEFSITTLRLTFNIEPSSSSTKMSSTMHFGPEWMRKPAPRSQLQPSPPPTVSSLPSGASTYSALVSTMPPAQPDKRDDAFPFKYSKEQMLQIFKEAGGGKGGLGLEVERWEGITHEIGREPVSLRELTDEEKKVRAMCYLKLCRRSHEANSTSPGL